MPLLIFFFFFFNDTATTEIYTLSLHDALPILATSLPITWAATWQTASGSTGLTLPGIIDEPGCNSGSTISPSRSEEHTSELQSHLNLVCRLLLEKKKKMQYVLW